MAITITSQNTTVGKFYLIPCMYVERDAWVAWIPDDGWVPVLGPRHEDKKHLDFPLEHYHIDWRFIAPRKFELADASRGGVVHGNVLTNTGGGKLSHAEPTMKRRKCHRVMPDHPRVTQAVLPPRRRASGDTGWQTMEREYACARLKPGNICPHRGVDLTPFIRQDGTVTCPAHGLSFDTTTGSLIPHHNAC